MPIRPIIDSLTSMRDRLISHSMLGEYKEYVALRKEFAEQCVKFPEEVRYIQPRRGNISIFSKYGRNIIKTWFKEFFRTKTPEEKQMEKIAERIKAERALGIYA